MTESLLVGLVLVMVANGAPILARHVPLSRRLAYPLDARWHFIDGRRILGASKTWRGVVAALVATPVAAVLFQLSWRLGMGVALLAMLGDALSSFVNRRLDIRPSGMAVGLDQIPESILPFVFLRAQLEWSWAQVFIGVGLFLLLELALSRILFWLSIRKRPY